MRAEYSSFVGNFFIYLQQSIKHTRLLGVGFFFFAQHRSYSRKVNLVRMEELVLIEEHSPLWKLNAPLDGESINLFIIIMFVTSDPKYISSFIGIIGDKSKH